MRAYCTTRRAPEVCKNSTGRVASECGASQPPFDSFNLATHVGDDPAAVQANRDCLRDALGLPGEPFWLEQQHTVDCVDLNAAAASTWQAPVADAAWTQSSNQVAVVMTADCIPILVTNKTGTLAAAIHAGWRGLADGIVTQTLQRLPDEAENLLVWIGPCIRQPHFEVGQDVFDRFAGQAAHNARFFEALPAATGKYLADLPGLLKSELTQLGVQQISDSGLCSYADSARFYSYRRDGQTGRMASLIWLES
ncbi:peptidoglycan editing factor PgeF [Thiomicrorhabdus cannonii]|uniref:peptidoglycan editing factor PgeF n=1 Tax=Thiomicrorhabdus cannonii TaxID=2748011 RepID=UPI0015BF4444